MLSSIIFNLLNIEKMLNRFINNSTTSGLAKYFSNFPLFFKKFHLFSSFCIHLDSYDNIV